MRNPGGYFKKIKHFLRLDKLSPGVRRVVVGVVGIIVVLIGIAMLVLPGPGLLMIPLGLAILGTEFYWARCWMRKFWGLLKQARARFRRRRAAKQF
jgi:uncharacterized protein (TIGR02611 family)